MKKNLILRLAFTTLIFSSSFSAFAVATTYQCKVAGVFENESRVHLRCDKPAGPITFFAVPISKLNHAKNFVSVSTAAMLAGRTVEVFFNTTDTSGTAFGCLASDCRYASAMEMR
jgi:hypothetical protein